MRLALVAAAAALLASCGGGAHWGPHWGMGHAPGYGPRAPATVRLEPRSASTVSGRVWFTQGTHHTMAHFDVSGLRPGIEHGIHIHEKGDCSAADAASAGGHFNPAGHPHAHWQAAQRHSGDLPNMRADANGVARGVFAIDPLDLGSGPAGILGRSVVVHRDPDDHRSQPAGNSGPRVACGVIAGR